MRQHELATLDRECPVVFASGTARNAAAVTNMLFSAVLTASAVEAIYAARKKAGLPIEHRWRGPVATSVVAFVAAGRCEAEALANVLAGRHDRWVLCRSSAIRRRLITQTLYSNLRADGRRLTADGCTLLTAGGQSQLITLVVNHAKGSITTRPSCEHTVRLIRVVADVQVLSALSRARIEHVQVRGTRATPR